MCFFGLPLFLLPWGFHVRTCLVMFVLGFLKVWPSHPHLLLRISISIWAWCVLSQRYLLLTLSIQCIRRILLRQWLTNVWILISVVLFIRHVSTPFSNTDFIFVLNKRIFVVSPITFDFHTFINRWKATLALLILFLYLFQCISLKHDWCFASSICSQDLCFPFVEIVCSKDIGLWLKF